MYSENPNTKLVQIFLECETGYFGPDCKSECGHCLNASQCHRGNGTCLRGCSPGYIGSFCRESTFSSVFTLKNEIFDQDNFNPSTSYYILVLAAVILLEYCRYGVKHYSINSSFCYLHLRIVYRVPLLVIWIELCVQM